MASYQTKTFTHQDKTYEIRIASDGHTIRIRVFLNDKPVNGYSYSVDVLTQLDATTIDPTEVLIQAAQTDVKNGVWDQYVRAVQALNSNGGARV